MDAAGPAQDMQDSVLPVETRARPLAPAAAAAAVPGTPDWDPWLPDAGWPSDLAILMRGVDGDPRTAVAIRGP
jgi:hypothetical protein